MKAEMGRTCRRHGRLKIEYKVLVMLIEKTIFMQMCILLHGTQITALKAHLPTA
jgi:hypothetical protein